MRLAWGVLLLACVACEKSNPTAVDGGPDFSSTEMDLAMPGGDGNEIVDLATPADLVPTYSVGGTASGVGGTLILQNNGADDLPVGMSGAFVFSGRLPTGAAYNVTVKTHPPGQLCTVAEGSGSIAGADVTSVLVTCVAARTVGGTMGGILAGTLVLRNNGGDDLALTMSGGFTFATPVAETASYDVTVHTQPTGQVCSVTNGSGTITGADISDVAVQCRALDVKINEVHARPSSGAVPNLGDANGDNLRDPDSDEFIEIINNELFTVDISGWVLRTGRTPMVRFTFPPTTMLATGVRAVVFNRGTPTGGFGAGQVFTSTMDLQLSDAPSPTPTPFSVVLVTRATLGLAVDTYAYDDNTWGACTRCPSQTRSPEGTGAFTDHSSIPVVTDGGVFWSPGVANNEAVLKLNTLASEPRANAANVSVQSPIVMHFNMFLNPADLVDSKLKLFRSTCTAPMNPIAMVVPSPSPRPLADGVVSMWPAAPLDYGEPHCVEIDGSVRSLVNSALGATVRYQFTTRAAMSATASTVVISEVGGSDFVANNEFVELYNPTNAPIDLTGWQIQRRSAGGGAVECFATIAGGSIPAHGYFLIAPMTTFTGPTPDQLSGAGAGLRGGNESVVLRSPGGSCAGNTNATVVDAVSYGVVTDIFGSLQLPSVLTPLGDGSSVERKACWDSTLGAMDSGAHAGNAEKIGANNADFVVRPSPQPQNASASPEPRTCPNN